MSSLKLITLSGTTGVTQNLYLYEYLPAGRQAESEMIMVDCGVGFPESEMFGVDLVIPDFTYVKENQDKLKGILITHGHEDHLGALPFLYKEIKRDKFQIYSTKLVAGFIEDKFTEYGIRDARVNVFNPETDVLTIGVFKISPFRISHSVPDSVGFCIDTPEGQIFHVADYKFDWTPVDERPFDLSRAANLASRGVLALASDCLGATSYGYTESEREIEGRVQAIAESAKGQVFFTTISSNISRVKQALNVAQKLGRKVSFIGRSIDKKAEIARNLGYLAYPRDLVMPSKKLGKLPKNKRMYIISGSYGQVGSALYRVSQGEHDFISVEPDDIVIFSGDPAPPGSKDNVDFVVDKLIEANVDVHYYDMQEDLHVSGHGSQKDIEILSSVLKPKYFVPIGGTIRHMRAYKALMVEMGFEKNNVFEPLAGDIIEFQGGLAKKAGNIPTREILVDGLGIGDVGNIVLRDRHKLSQDGVAIALIQIDKAVGKLITDPEIISRGFVYHEKNKDLLGSAGRFLKRELEFKRKIDRKVARDVAIDFLERFFFEEIGRRPMILPVVVEI